MIYEYFCPNCRVIDEVEKSAESCLVPEFCPACQAQMKRQYTPPQLMNIGVDEPVYNPAFGTHMTQAQARVEAKRRGWEEIGNEKPSPYAPKLKEYASDDYFV